MKASDAATSADQSLVCWWTYLRRRGWFGSSYIGRFSSARSVTSTSKPPCSRARSVIHSATDGPIRPGRVEPMMTRKTGLATRSLQKRRGWGKLYLTSQPNWGRWCSQSSRSVEGENRLDRSAQQGIGDRRVDLGEGIVPHQPVDREPALPVQLEEPGDEHRRVDVAPHRTPQRPALQQQRTRRQRDRGPAAGND